MEEDKHKRSKSGIAKSILHRVSSRPEVRSENSSVKSGNGIPPPLVPTQSAPITQKPVATSRQSGPSSIENSVRLFKLYEALRKGDTTTISNAIRDASAGTETVEGTTILHLAVQCADTPVVEYILANSGNSVDVEARDKEGNTPLHVASQLSRGPVVRLLLEQRGINDAATNYQGRTALDFAKNPEVFQQLQLARSMYIDASVKRAQELVRKGNYEMLEKMLMDDHFQSTVDVNGGELATEAQTTETGGTLLHEAARKKDARLIEILLLNGADPFRRDRKGKLPQDVTKDDKTRALLKKSPAAAVAQRGIQEKTILGSGPAQAAGSIAGEGLGSKEAREMKGYLKKWTNYTSGYKLRWFVLEDGVMSYYKHQDDAGSACRGAINMKIARLHMDPQDKLRFEIIGKSSVKYHLKANHQIEAKRWFWALNNAIQWTKDEAKEERKKTDRKADLMQQAKAGSTRDADNSSMTSSRIGSKLGATTTNLNRTITENDDAASSIGEPTAQDEDVSGIVNRYDTTAMPADPDDEDDYGDDTSSIEAVPVNRDAFLIAAQSSRLQLELMSQIAAALKAEQTRSPSTTISEPNVVQALSSYESAVANLNSLIADLGRIARDRETYWYYRLEQEVNVRRVWEESMTRVALEQEELEKQIGESEEKRKRTKRALRDALEGQVPTSLETSTSPIVHIQEPYHQQEKGVESRTNDLAIRKRSISGPSRKSTLPADLVDSDDDEEEFFDAVDAGEVEVVEDLPSQNATPVTSPKPATGSSKELVAAKTIDLSNGFKGYEDPVRKRLKMDADDRPKISLWSILKSMIGKDMTKMTLPVSFNEPTSLLQRVAEDMEYTDLLDTAAERVDSTERLVYVAAFAASEYASTSGRVAKPFNPLLAETYEYARPDKGYRFLIEQVSHHPPIGAAWAESAKWDYYGESAVRSKFYGKSFDINPLGTWFLKLRPTSSPGTEEMYTWKKVTSSVIGIITGNPTVDNYGPMEVRNHTTGEVAILDFKARGWKASSAFQVGGKVLDRDGNTRWSIGGRWNDKIYARLTPGYEEDVSVPSASKKGDKSNQAFLVWEAHERPKGIPFNLTPFVVTLNALPDKLRPILPPTDTRLRPDQRAMEDGEYDFAASEKNRVEEKQRATRRQRESNGEEFIPQWFVKSKDPITGEDYWNIKKTEKGGIEYWKRREIGDWTGCENIF